MNKIDKIETLVRGIYRKHDLSTDAFTDSINSIVSNCMEEIDKYPEIEINKFFVIQMILENY